MPTAEFEPESVPDCPPGKSAAEPEPDENGCWGVEAVGGWKTTVVGKVSPCGGRAPDMFG